MLIAVAGATGRLGKHLVEVLEERGHSVVPISRTHGVDIITGAGLAEAMTGVECIIDAATGPSPDRDEATAFFTTASRNLHEAGHAAGVRRMVVVSIVGIEGLVGGYSVAKVAHEQAALAGPIPVRILRATQFHEFVGQLLDWDTQGEVGYVNEVQTSSSPPAASPRPWSTWPSTRSGPRRPARCRRRRSGDRASRGSSTRPPCSPHVAGTPLKVELVTDPDNPDAVANATGALLPGPNAILAGPTFEQWLDATMG